jgi:drug/metabolite transporter (DMT)-like permease
VKTENATYETQRPHKKALRSPHTCIPKKSENLNPSTIGESAAILTSCLWTASSLFFTSAGKKFGAFSVNTIRTTIAIGLLIAAHVVLLGTILPLANNGQWLWVGLSGIVGLGIGDFGLFAAYVTIGPRRSVLIQASAPIFTAFAAYFVLPNESLSAIAILGIAVTLFGIFIVILEKEEKTSENPLTGSRKKLGLLFGLVSAMGQGFGVVLSKKGMYYGVTTAMNPVSVALIRMLFAGIFVWTCAVVAGKLPTLQQSFRNKDGLKYTTAGAIVGPFLGMTISMIAVADTQAGIAQTLMSLMPIFIIPVVWIVFKEKTNWRGIIGAIIAIIGVAILSIL